MDSALWRHGRKGIFLMFGLLSGTCPASEPARPRDKALVERVVFNRPEMFNGPVTSLKDLKRLNAAQLEKLYASMEVGAQPVGFTRGEVMFLANTAMPRMKTNMAGVIWKGKHFTEQGEFINQWAGFRAIHSRSRVGPSHFDGRPSMILEYPPETPYFGKMSDEVREVAPGTYLAMVFERNPPHKFRGFIGLELEGPKGFRARRNSNSERDYERYK